ncbi:MAG: hypothetical protein KUG79_16440 [Pseudomonadales bacterium]|nr:hypothetical protein [Pseudomonadales bacterium]
MSKPNVVVSFPANAEQLNMLQDTLNDVAKVIGITGLPEAERIAALKNAQALLTFNPAKDLNQADWSAATELKLIQLISAGADHLSFDKLPKDITVACNAGGYADAIAEHILAMILALQKRLMEQHLKLTNGEFDQSGRTKALRGSVVGILGHGGIGRAAADLLRPFDTEIHAINRRGATQDQVTSIGTLDDLEQLLRKVDILIIAIPLNARTQGLLGERELGWMKPDAILVNVARGEIIDQGALYRHLQTHPKFLAGIEAWWVEPARHGKFELEYPLLELPNVLGCPHNSAQIPGAMLEGLKNAALNVHRWFDGKKLPGVLDPADFAGSKKSAFKLRTYGDL